MSTTGGIDVSGRVIGQHPFPVRVFFGHDRARAFMADASGATQAPGLQIITQAAETALAVAGQADKAGVLSTARNLKINFPFLLNLACQTNTEKFLERLHDAVVAQGLASIDASDLRVAKAVKNAVDEARILGPQAIVNAAMTHLAGNAGTGQPYGTLIGYINHLLTNRGANPRIQHAHPPIDGPDEITASGIDLWWIKEGSATIVFQVSVPLRGDRPHIQFILNVAKDLTTAADEVRRIHSDFVELYRMDPRYVMEPLGTGTATVNNWRGACPVAVLAAEWFEGHELHVYEKGPQLYIWQDQERSRSHPLPPDESDRVWQEMIRICARYTRRTPAGLLPVGAHINAGDFIFRQGADGRWEVLLIWFRLPPAAAVADEFLVVTALLAGVDAFGEDRDTTVWWDQPRRAIGALSQGFAEAGFSESQIKDLFRCALDGPFTQFASEPERIPGLPAIGPDETEGMRRVFSRARQALAEHLQGTGG